jgi:CRP-like cAMP-binding protein
VDPAAELPGPNDDWQAREAGPAASAPDRQDGSERKVTVSFTLAMKQSGPPLASHGPRRLTEAPARTAIKRILRWLHRPAWPAITTAQRPDLEAARPPRPEGTTEEMAGARPPAVSFWEALDPAEREALTGVAVPQKFPAGMTLMREGDQADHVMVIIEGRAEVRVDENGWERTLAERGPGELIGERGGLQVRIRSASVIALEAVRVLTVRTRDFQAFVNAHPKVFDIVEQQLYDRLTEPATVSPAEGAMSSLLPLNGENCTILYSDVVGFSSSDRSDADRLVIRKALLDMTRLTLQRVPGAWSQDRGDGLLTVVPPSVPTADVIALLHRELPPALDRHNRTDRESTRFRLRIAVDVGPVTSDTIGVSGEAIIIAARMLEAPIFKAAIGVGTANLGVIASRFVYDTAIKHSLNALDLAGYSQVLVEVKGLTIPAWMKLFTVPVSPVYFYRSAAPDSFGMQLAALVRTVDGDP